MMADDPTAKRLLPAAADPEESVAAIKRQDEALQLLQDLRLYLNTLENTYRRSIRKADALPLLRRCITVIEKATSSCGQPVLPRLLIQGLKNIYTPIGPEPGPSRVYNETPRANAGRLKLKEWKVKRQRQILCKQALERFERNIYELERFVFITQNECTTEDRREEIQDLFNRVDTEQLSLKGKTEVLGEVTNTLEDLKTPEAPVVHKPREAVTRTEIAPMLPYKGYKLPPKDLSIAGISDPAVSYEQLESAENMQTGDLLVRKEIRKDIISRLSNATKVREEGKDKEEGEEISKSHTDMNKGDECIVD